MSFFWGIFIFKEEVRNIFGACMAAITLVVGIWGMSIYSNTSDESEVGPISSSNPSGYGSIESQELDLIQGNGKGKSIWHSITLGTFEKGIICAVFNGLWAG